MNAELTSGTGHQRFDFTLGLLIGNLTQQATPGDASRRPYAASSSALKSMPASSGRRSTREKSGGYA